jgi:hypothetical protein
MNKKLTLMLDEEIISRAKAYASENHESLSRMVAKYFTYLAGKDSINEEGTRLPKDIEQLIGIVHVPATIDVKADYRRHRAEKSLHD